MGLVEVIMESSSLVRDAQERARVAGLAEGRVEGPSTEARRLLRLAPSARFPGLETMPELDRIENLADLESLLIQVA